jgi:hypothetical protein
MDSFFYESNWTEEKPPVKAIISMGINNKDYLSRFKILFKGLKLSYFSMDKCYLGWRVKV